MRFPVWKTGERALSLSQIFVPLLIWLWKTWGKRAEDEANSPQRRTWDLPHCSCSYSAVKPVRFPLLAASKEAPAAVDGGPFSLHQRGQGSQPAAVNHVSTYCLFKRQENWNKQLLNRHERLTGGGRVACSPLLNLLSAETPFPSSLPSARRSAV